MSNVREALRCICCGNGNVKQGNGWANCRECHCEWQPALAAPEPQKEGAAGWDTERHHALREAYCIGISDDYFKARPDDDAAITRMAFEAGFSRGFDAAVRRKDAEMLYAAAPPAPADKK